MRRVMNLDVRVEMIEGIWWISLVCLGYCKESHIGDFSRYDRDGIGVAIGAHLVGYHSDCSDAQDDYTSPVSLVKE